MNLTTKGDLVDAALRKLGIASDATITDVEPQSTQDAVTDLEMMMAEWYQGGDGIDAGYAFAVDDAHPETGDAHGMKNQAISTVVHNLAVRIAPDYAIEPMTKLVMLARNGKELLYKGAAVNRARKAGRLGYPSRMPTGSGNRGFAQTGFNYFHRREAEDADDSTAIDEGAG